MRSVPTILGVVLTLGVGYLLYDKSLTRAGSADAAPEHQVDLVGIQSDLLAIAQAERQYLVTHGTYVPVEQLQREGLVQFSGTERRGYTLASDVDGNRRFTITATPLGGHTSWPSISIDETMQVSRR